MRPAAKCLMEAEEGGASLRVLEADAIWVVLHAGRPINLTRTKIKDRHRKYERVGFSNPAHAYRLAERLNSLFRTKCFSVGLYRGEPVSADCGWIA